MNVNDNRLKKLINKATVYCNDCPIYEVDNWTACDKYRQKIDEDTCLKSCEEALLDWIQEFDITEALEAGTHIINDQVVFPPLSLPDDFKLNTPCDSAEICDSSCPWLNECPFEDFD
jgi:hypothetical protein